MSNEFQDVVRDKQGMGYHSCLDQFFAEIGEDENVDPKPWFEANGFEYAYDDLEPYVDGGEDNPIYAAYEQDTDLSGWEPERPEGDGWFLAAVYDNEDGVWALFLRSRSDS